MIPSTARSATASFPALFGTTSSSAPAEQVQTRRKPMAFLSHSTTLWRKIQLAEGRLDAAARAFWTHPRLAAFFPEFLFALYSSMRSTVPLMEAARDRAQYM